VRTPHPDGIEPGHARPTPTVDKDDMPIGSPLGSAMNV